MHHDRRITEKRMVFPAHGAAHRATSASGSVILARKNARRPAVYGTGGQAPDKVLALQNERPITTYKGLQPQCQIKPDKHFCKRMATLVDAIHPVDNPREVVKGADVLICATSSNVPVVRGRVLETRPACVNRRRFEQRTGQRRALKEGRRENDDETVRRADFIRQNWRDRSNPNASRDF